MTKFSTINNLTHFVKETTRCSRKKAKKLASEYATKVGKKTTFSCDSKKYPDAIRIERIYDGWNHTFSVIGKHDTKTNLELIRKFLDKAAAESAYFARKV